METTMTKPQFDVWNPLPGCENAPVITAEQMSNFLYTHICSDAGKQIAAAINATNTPDFYDALQVTYGAPVTTVYGFDIGATAYSKTNRAWTGPMVVAPAEEQEEEHEGDQSWKYVTCIHPRFKRGVFTASELTTDGAESYGCAPPKPTFLPIDRPVRIKDLEPGDVLRFCYEDNGIAPHDGYAVLGSEVVFKRVSRGGDIVYRCTNGQGNIVEDQHCPAKLFSFVRRPFKAGEAVRYKAEATKAAGWEGALLVDTSEADRRGLGVAVINHKGVYGSISASDLERIL
jgi:hypothetical protein